jgi:hypothetical protein
MEGNRKNPQDILFGVQITTVNGVCVRELRRPNRKEKVAERVIKYWKILWEMDKTSLIREALKQ